MSRFEIDDQFLGHHKTKRAARSGWDAIGMWLALRTYVAVNNSNGVIPDEDIDDLSDAPKNPRKWLKVLVECGKPMPEGGRGIGLVEQVRGGWKLHDYEDHGLSPVEIERRRELSRDRQRRWRQSRIGVTAEVSNGSESRVTNAVTDASRDASGDTPDPIRSDPKRNNNTHPPLQAVKKPTADPMAESMSGRGHWQRSDVREVFNVWKSQVGLSGAQCDGFRNPHSEHIASAIDSYGLDSCLLVAKHCMADDWVNGKLDDKGAKHITTAYIFGKLETFERILTAANKSAEQSSKPQPSYAEQIARQKAL